MTEARQILLASCKEILPEASSLQGMTGTDAAEALRAQMRELAGLAQATADAATEQINCEHAAATAALDAFERLRKAVDAALHQLELSDSVTLPYAIRHDRLLALERLVETLRQRMLAIGESLGDFADACSKALVTIQIQRDVAFRASSLSNFRDHEWEAWAANVGAQSATQARRENSNRKKVMGVAFGLMAGALCVLLGWPLVLWSWEQAVELGFGGVMGSLFLTGLGAFLVARDNGFGFIPLILGGLSLLIVLLGPTILIGGAIAGYYLAHYSADYLGRKENQRSAQISYQHQKLMNRFLSHASDAAPIELATEAMRETQFEMASRSVEFETWIERSTEALQKIRSVRAKIYFGISGFDDVAAAEESIWIEAGLPAPLGFNSSDGVPIYSETLR